MGGPFFRVRFFCSSPFRGRIEVGMGLLLVSARCRAIVVYEMYLWVADLRFPHKSLRNFEAGEPPSWRMPEGVPQIAPADRCFASAQPLPAKAKQ